MGWLGRRFGDGLRGKGYIRSDGMMVQRQMSGLALPWVRAEQRGTCADMTLVSLCFGGG